ncbi:hypothetical protein NDU88_003015 [Pleurodeles waltl]|uniref:Secreted protein n=1 Tax=Pleurodeles waltl TaxID=8319 RepID=A0AAV7LFR1_PLEWA|nr:hypothetical protein NDU88_003015 [Pleurodeles waltl]
MPRGVAACFVAPAVPCPAPSGWRVLLGLVVPPGAGSQVEKMPRGVAARFVAPAVPCPAASGWQVLLGLVVPPGARDQTGARVCVDRLGPRHRDGPTDHDADEGLVVNGDPHGDLRDSAAEERQP